MSTPAVTPDQNELDSGAGGWEAAVQPAAAAPSPAQTPDATPNAGPNAPTAQPAAGTSPAPAAPASVPPVVLTPARTGIMGVVDKITDALAGTNRPEIAHDQDGNAYVKNTSLTRGQQWQRIAGEGIVGAAKGFAAGKGAGNMGAAAAAGVDAGAQQVAQENQQGKDVTAEARQQNLDAANHQLLTQKVAINALTLRNLKFQGDEASIKASEAHSDWLEGHNGVLLGYAHNAKELANMMIDNPSFHEDHIQKSLLQPNTIYNPDGTVAGIAVYRMLPGSNDQVVPAGTDLPSYDPATHTVKTVKTSDPMKQGDYLSRYNAAFTQRDAANVQAATLAHTQAQTAAENATAASTTQKTANETAELPSKIAENKARANEANAVAQKNRVESQQLSQAADSQTIQGNAAQLVEGTMDPSNLSKRSKTYDATLAAANTYSMQKFGVPFDVAGAAADYKFASAKGTKDTLNYLNSLTGHDNQGGNLGLLVQMSDKMPRTSFPPVNDAVQWAKLETGNTQVAAYHAALVEVDDQIAKILQGGSGGGTSDAKMRQAAEILNKNFSADQVKAVATNTLRPLLANRKAEMIGGNRYLQQWYGQTAQHPGIPAPAGAPIGATQVWHDPKDPSKIVGYTVNGGYQPAAAAVAK